VIRTATHSDLAALQDVAARADDAPYDLATVIEEKCFEAGLHGTPVTRVFEVADRIEGVIVTCGPFVRLLAVARHARRRGIGGALLATADAQTIAAEPGNYFTPGIVETDTQSLAFFHGRGYREKRHTFNLEADLSAIPDASIGDSRDEIVRATRSDATRFLGFVESEFGPIWRFETARAFERDRPPAFMSIRDGEITGFAVHDVNNRGLAFFGPTGVARSMRGRGLGRRLLLASLSDLGAMGYRSATIPWTDALDFYRKSCGAKPSHRFVTLARESRLPESVVSSG
jgi:GNAT superfamily N-acetyltransferase